MTECERLLQSGFVDEDFLKEEVRNGYRITELQKKVWAIELDLHRKIAEVCEKYSLRHWVAAGTLLGAIRHNGFIPWDDDFDIWMPREDYEKLLSVGEKEFGDPYFLQTTLNDTDYYSAFARLRNSNTTGILNVSKNNKCNNGIYIDIFPMDGAADKESTRKRRNFINHGRNALAHAYMYNVNPSFLARTANKILRFPLVKYDYKKTYAKVNDYARKYKFGETGYVGVTAFSMSFRRVVAFKKEYFKETVMHRFEFTEVPVPVGFHEILTEKYGNYMEFPPVEIRGAWHEFDFAPDTPYREYMQNK